MPNLPCVSSDLSVAFGRLATTDNEVDLSVGRLERTIGVAPFWRWWWSPLFSTVVMAVVIILATSIFASIFSSVVTLVVAAVTPVVVMPVVSVIATVVVASVITAIVAAVIMSIPIIIARIGSVITEIMSIRSTVTIVEALATVPVIVVVALGLLGVGRHPKGTLQLFALPHGMLGIAVKLALVVHDHVEVTFKEGGGSWWICHIDFTLA
jgi:hypothetical protein